MVSCLRKDQPSQVGTPTWVGVHFRPILGPLLFVFFFNDITENLIHSKIVIYADDTVIFCESKKLEEIEICLNADLKNLRSWFKENELLLNLKPEKRKSYHLARLKD